MNKGLLKGISRPAVILGLFALIGVLLLAIVNQQTKQRIAENERAALMDRLLEVVDKESHDNDLLNDKIELATDTFNRNSSNNNNESITVYRATKGGKPSAAIFVTSTSRGYKGSIRLVVGVRMDKTISGVRVVQHNETPGLGDKMETQKSRWVFGFNNTSITRPGLPQWGVKKDGGYFDQFTGATITPRAIVGAVKEVLIWSNESDRLLSVFAGSTGITKSKTGSTEKDNE